MKTKESNLVKAELLSMVFVSELKALRPCIPEPQQLLFVPLGSKRETFLQTMTMDSSLREREPHLKEALLERTFRQ